MSNLKNIIKDGYLKAPIEKNAILNEGEFIYKVNKYIYFSTTEKLFDKRVVSDISLYFSSELIYNKIFYVSTVHTSTPNILTEWNYIEGSKIYKNYKRKYPKNYKDYNKVLKDLYNFSISAFLKFFQAYNQVAVKNKINIKNNLIGIKFNKKPTLELLFFIKKYYPNIKIKIIN